MGSGRSTLAIARIEEAASETPGFERFVGFLKWKSAVAILPLWPNPDDPDGIFQLLLGFCLFECGD